MKWLVVPALFATVGSIAFLSADAGAQSTPQSSAKKRAAQRGLPSNLNGKIPTKLPAKKQTTQAPEGEELTANGNSEAERSSRPRRVDLAAGNTIRLNYGLAAWNKTPTKIDSASILMREGTTGRTVQIYLEETAPDSSVFSGLYSINWQNIERLQVEFYVPPQDLLATPDGLKKIIGMIADRDLKRLPFILRKGPGGLQMVEIYDTKEQARAAMKAFRAEQQLLAVQNNQNQKFPSDSQIEVANLASDLKEKEAAAKSLSERIRLEQVDSKRLSEFVSIFNSLKPAEQASRRSAAEKLASEGAALFRDGNYIEAQKKFDAALEQDPSNRAYYYQYGVTLYKTTNFNRSIVFLELADSPSVNPVEKNFYLGLNFFQLKEYGNARDKFDKVIASSDAEMAPASQFYKGVTYYEQKSWEEAKPAFQAVLDSSKDPKLDERAEAYLEQILRTQQFEAEKSKKWQLSATVGEIFDSNILLTADSLRDQGQATNTEGYRTLLSGSARYRPIYEATHEFAAQLDLLTMYTVDKSFQTDQNLRNSDPSVVTVTLPWTHKGVLFGKGYKFDVVPGYESTWMSIENNENKEILGSILLSLNNLLVMNDSWFANYNLELRQDSSKLTSSTGDNDSSATKVKFIFNNLILLSDDKSKMMTAEADYTLNQAAGRNSVFNRYDLSVGYIQPFYFGTTANAKLSYFNLAYPQKTQARTDNSYTLALGASKPISDLYSVGLVGNYNINKSDDASNEYKKWSVMLTFSALYAF